MTGWPSLRAAGSGRVSARRSASCYPTRWPGLACCTCCSTIGSARHWCPATRCSTRRSPWASRRNCPQAPPTTWPVSARASRRTPRSSRTPNATAPSPRCTDRLRRRWTSMVCTASNRFARTGCGGSADWTSPRTVSSTRTSATRTSTVTVSRRSFTSTPSKARSTHRREPSPRLPRMCGCCRGRSVPAPSVAQRGSGG